MDGERNRLFIGRDIARDIFLLDRQSPNGMTAQVALDVKFLLRSEIDAGIMNPCGESWH